MPIVITKPLAPYSLIGVLNQFIFNFKPSNQSCVGNTQEEKIKPSELIDRKFDFSQDQNKSNKI